MGFEYDLSPHLNEAFYTNLHSTKWSERKDAIQDLINIAEKNQTFSPNDPEFQKLIGELSRILNKDNNINVAACAAQMLAKIAIGAPNVFKHAASSVILICLTRMKDVKPVIKNACSECLDASYSATTFSDVLDPIKSGLAITAPNSKIQSCEFFTRIMLKIDFPTAKSAAPATKEVVDQICKLAMGSDPNCRDASMRSLAAFMRAVTKQMATPLLSIVAEDKLKMAKIEENYDQFIVDHPFDDGKKKVETAAARFATPYDLSRHLNKEFYSNLASAKWSERKDAIQEIINIAEKNPVFVQKEDELQKAITELSRVFANDSNINVAACIALAFAKIAYGAADIFKHNAPSIILLCLNRSKDVKPVIKNACSECLDSAYSATTFSGVVGPIKEGLAMTAPGSKIQACEFFTRIMLKIDFASVKHAINPTKEVIAQLSKLALGSDQTCRDAAMKALGAFMRAVSKPLAAPLLSTVAADKLKMAKVEEYYEKFIAEFPTDSSMNGQNLADVSRPETAGRPVSSKPTPKPSSAAPKKQPFVNRGNTQPQLSVNNKLPTATPSSKPSTPSVRPSNPPKRPVSVSRGVTTPARPVSASRPIASRVSTPNKTVTPNVVRMPTANSNNKPVSSRPVATPSRTSVAPIKPNVVTTTTSNGLNNGSNSTCLQVSSTI
ncbi:Cytoskeleton-associated protein 5 [Aphelenchoides bicaudatus]|nr:Cytoskeleton-associated protein 5 [Aphelenchoides bicaudatus]